MPGISVCREWSHDCGNRNLNLRRTKRLEFLGPNSKDDKAMQRSINTYKGLLDALAAPSLQTNKVEFTRVTQRRNGKRKTELTQNWHTFEFPPE